MLFFLLYKMAAMAAGSEEQSQPCELETLYHVSRRSLPSLPLRRNP